MHRLLWRLLPIFTSLQSKNLVVSLITNSRSFSTLLRPTFQQINQINNMKRSFGTANDSNNVSPPPSASKVPFVVPLYCPPGFNIKRVRQLTQTSLLDTDVTSTQNSTNNNSGCVVYWMARDQRAHDNYSLLYAQGLAVRLGVPLRVVFNLVPKYLDATLRQYGFMIKGLRETEGHLRDLNIPFHLLLGDPVVNVPAFAQQHGARALITDFSPVRIAKTWFTKVAEVLDNAPPVNTRLPFYMVDAHNIVPCWVASDKLEYGARTLRGKIQTKMSEFLTDIPEPASNPQPGLLDTCPLTDWDKAVASLEINREVGEVDWLVPGRTGAFATLNKFIETGLKDFAEARNDPNRHVCSNLSPYFHFGQISPQRVVLILKQLKRNAGSVDVFVEEAVVRRELADNFVYYNLHYDSIQGAYSWAQGTLAVHSTDPRTIVYTRDQLERGETHDDLWNAAQLQVVQTGKMHGFMRMYWAKKILEWTRSPAEALQVSLYLNDKYQLDGRDPNGYVGCMWSIAGIHDQGWGERPIFGKIRYMNYQGCKRKFDVPAFVARYPPAARNAAAVSQSASSDAQKTIKEYFGTKKKD